MSRKEAREKAINILRRIYADEPVMTKAIDKAEEESDIKYLSTLLVSAMDSLKLLKKQLRILSPSQLMYIENEAYREAHKKRCRERYWRKKKEAEEAELAAKRLKAMRK